jgi:hypothetical protein
LNSTLLAICVMADIRDIQEAGHVENGSPKVVR